MPRALLTPAWTALGLLLTTASLLAADRFPGRTWETRPARDAGLDPDRLTAFSEFTGGRGVVVRHGWLVHTWGDFHSRGDVASAVKPLFTHFLFRAVREGRIASLDEPTVRLEPRLADLNPELDHKDRAITWRHFATQTSCYGLREPPGTAFAYNDWQMALFIDLLFPRVYGLPWPEVDAKLLHPLLRDTLGCEDEPSLLAFAGGRQPGRLAISPRDFARFGLLYLREGRWGDRQIVPAEDVRRALHSPLPATLPRAGTNAAAMLPDQRTLGSRRIPDNQTEHFGSYSFLWWVNGVQADGRRHWPDAPTSLFAALGHGGLRALAVMPDLDLIVSWNDTRIDSPRRENEAFRLLVAAVLRPGESPLPESAPRAEAPPQPAGEPTAQPRAAVSPFPNSPLPAPPDQRLRVVIETDAGGDPDDEQSLVRFLLYANEWDVEGLIANRPRCRDGENRNPERTGLGVVRRLVEAYATCHTNLVRNDPRYPDPAVLRQRTVAGYADTEDAVNLLIAAVDRPDPRPLWYSDWGSDRGSATNNLRRALDRVRRERGPDGYAKFKQRLRLSSADRFEEHTRLVKPAFPLWIDAWGPAIEGRRWYHRFSALTSSAGGFDVVRDVLTGHGPLGALYPTNTTHGCKEGDTMSFLYLVPNGLNAPEHPDWGGWGGRHAHQPGSPGKYPYLWRWPYFHAATADAWNGSTNRDNILLRWAADLQNDFRARLQWCVATGTAANHPPQVRLDVRGDITVSAEDHTREPGPRVIEVAAGASLGLSVAGSTDPDGDTLDFEWIPYPEAGTWRGPALATVRGAELRFTAPAVTVPETIHWIARITDHGTPPLTRYQRVVFTVMPKADTRPDPVRFALLQPLLTPPPELAVDFGAFRPLLRFYDGRPVTGVTDWAERRREILDHWHAVMGPWPPLLERPTVEVIARERETREPYELRRVRVGLAPERTFEGWLLVPDGAGPFPAVFVPFYEPETSIGRGKPQRDFARQLARRGFVALAVGSPGGDARKPDTGSATCQPLSYLGYLAANAANALAILPEVDAGRLGIVGHSYGGKWALFGAALCDRYACAVWSDPGIVWDEARPNVNYWDPWYLGRELEPGELGVPPPRPPGLPSPEHPRTGAYARLVRDGCDLHELMGLMAPRPFLVSGGSEDSPERWRPLNHVRAVNRLLGREDRVGLTRRPAHDPTPESNAELGEFLELHLKPAAR